MNSKQRKQFRKKWKYQVTIGSIPDSRVPFRWDAVDWAYKTYGKHKFKIATNDWNVLLFDNEANALDFALRWA